MKLTKAPKKLKFINIFSFVMLVASFLCLSVSIYAWVTFRYELAEMPFNAGKLEPRTEVYYWNKSSEVQHKWEMISFNNEDEGGTSFSASFGVLDYLYSDLNSFGMYLKIKVNDYSGAKYKWQASVLDIEIQVKDKNGNQIVASPDNYIGLIDYFSEDEDSEGSQKCFYFSETTDSNNLNPEGMTFGDIKQITQKGQAFSENFISEDNWLYIHISPGTAPGFREIHNIIRCVPLKAEGYYLQFNFTIRGEGRTADYE